MHRLGKSRVRDDQGAAVEHGVADETVDEGSDLVSELLRLGGELRHRLRQSVAERHVLAVERALELVLVVPRDAHGRAGADHVHDEAKDRGRGGAPVDEVAEEDGLPSVRVAGIEAAIIDGPTEPPEEVDQLAVASVDVADDVERTGLVSPVRPQALADHLGAVDVVDAVQHVHLPEAFAVQVVDRAT